MPFLLLARLLLSNNKISGCIAFDFSAKLLCSSHLLFSRLEIIVKWASEFPSNSKLLKSLSLFFWYAIDQEDQEKKTLFGQRKEPLFVLLLVALECWFSTNHHLHPQTVLQVLLPFFLFFFFSILS